ncbi:MAG: DUF1830 domain-containing protein [Leptolyngbyaceae cyanobacterium SU_3_3]|nr:DUF1830 domain-containing protein [Leptolyngbyaceae cyanobacterium SU_3_3]NJR52627.1 DUF1830 domain-containing protein [Leptolyngbyaceae cyanobacterium CSU_1_3]
MTQVLDHLPCRKTKKILCCYTNTTRHIQIARISNITHCFFEKVIFPRQRLLFETHPDAWLEIYSSEQCSAILAERILCNCLQAIV